MNSDSVKFLQDTLLDWFQAKGRVFPWRREDISDYELVVCETLLQRTKAETISKFYEVFFRRFPSWEDLSAAEIPELEEVLRPIGLYKQRAKRLKGFVMEMKLRNWIFPTDREDLELIPFVGQYIANAIELLIFKKPKALLDVNMSRLLERYFGERTLVDIRYDPYLQNLAQEIATHVKSKELNWAILDFAALTCKARNPDHKNCPLRKSCQFFRHL